MRLFSQDLSDGQTMPQAQVFNGMGYQGENLSPQLQWDDVPAGTRSFVITCFDPDAPTGCGWWHWVVINIPAEVTAIEQGAGSGKADLPAGALQTRTDFGTSAYGGAAPPEGEKHRYVFTVHAMDTDKLDLSSDASGAMVGFNVHFHALASASLTVTFN